MSAIEDDAKNVKQKINEDIASAYSDIQAFSDIYGKATEAEKDIILLGSLINSLNEFYADSLEKNLAITQLQEQALTYVDNILNEYKNANVPFQQKLNRDYSGHITEKKPGETLVFNCSNVVRKISQHFSLTEISLDLKLGEITSLVGENGNGKTTLLNLIAGEIMPTKGTVSYPLLNVEKKLNWFKIKTSIGYVRQSLTPWSDLITLKKHLQLSASIKGIRGNLNNTYYNSIVTRLDLKKFEDCKWSELSGGYKLRFELARQLIWRPKLLILDEPLAYLDIKSQLQFLNDLRNLTNSIKHSMSVVISSQHLYEIESISDNIIFIREGKPTYNGRMLEVGQNNRFCCYELFTPSGLSSVQEALNINGILEIRQESFNLLIYTELHINAKQLLLILADNNIQIKYFRDISRSTRLFFEK